MEKEGQIFHTLTSLHISFSLSIMLGIPLTIGYYLLQLGQISFPYTM